MNDGLLRGIARVLRKRVFGKVMFMTARFAEGIVQLMFEHQQTKDFARWKDLPAGSLIQITA